MFIVDTRCTSTYWYLMQTKGSLENKKAQRNQQVLKDDLDHWFLLEQTKRKTPDLKLASKNPSLKRSQSKHLESYLSEEARKLKYATVSDWRSFCKLPGCSTRVSKNTQALKIQKCIPKQG